MPWIRLDDAIYTHPKIVSAGPEASWMYVAGLCYCSHHKTDGVIPKAAIPYLVASIRKPEEVAERLVVVGLWDDVSGRYIVPDYLEYQRSKVEIEEDRERKRKAGSKGGKVSAERRWGSKALANGQAESKQSAYSSGYGTPEAESNPPTPTDTHEKQPTGRKLVRCEVCTDELDPDGYCQTCSVVRL